MTKIMIALIFGLAAPAAQAYLDPGTGSMLIQGIVAGTAALIFALKTYWYKIAGFFGKKSSASLLDDDDEDEDEGSRPLE